jgi:hypothetical protein
MPFVMGHEALKLSPNGKVLMTLGKEGAAGNGLDTFDRPTGVAIAANEDIFVSDGHQPNTFNNARIVKFDKNGKFTWERRGSASGEYDEPHDIFNGGSQQSLYVARTTPFTSAPPSPCRGAKKGEFRGIGIGNA